MNSNNEKTSIRISIILIILALMLVYKIFIDKSNYIKNDWSENATGSVVGISDTDTVNIWNNNNKNWYKLSWTNVVTDDLQSLDILQIPYKYITKWPNSIYIVYLDNYNQTVKNKIMYENSGNYKLINTPQQKLKDQIEWDEVLYINNPSRKWKLVVFIVTKWLDSRLVQVNKDDYAKYKKYIYYNLTN